jgi:hypothetical protein
MSTKVNLRCSSNPKNLLARMRLDGEKPVYTQPDNLIELSCRSCTVDAKRADPRVIRVLHLFDFAGEFVRTETKRTW